MKPVQLCVNIAVYCDRDCNINFSKCYLTLTFPWNLLIKTQIFARYSRNTKQLTLWCTVLLENVSVSDLAKNWNREVHYRLYKIPPVIPILIELSSPCFVRSHFNIILLCTLSCSKRSPFFRISYQNPVGIFIFRTCQMPRPSHCTCLYYCNNSW